MDSPSCPPLGPPCSKASQLESERKIENKSKNINCHAAVTISQFSSVCCFSKGENSCVDGGGGGGGVGSCGGNLIDANK